ncbi:unnamed protein product [Cylicocyclus nassatus]|uniref:Uncharacterized protein n=1 Tax=Cylicocyclus nassatus TaxID=53992 RepID=A0AA36MAU5_CYLNA|nr:unnamed protein product [Cylicocyclus nassatus]
MRRDRWLMHRFKRCIFYEKVIQGIRCDSKTENESSKFHLKVSYAREKFFQIAKMFGYIGTSNYDNYGRSELTSAWDEIDSMEALEREGIRVSYSLTCELCKKIDKNR